MCFLMKNKHEEKEKEEALTTAQRSENYHSILTTGQLNIL